MRKENIAFDKASVRSIDPNGYMRVAVSNISKACVNPYYGREVPGHAELGLDPEKIYQGLRPAEELEKAKDTFNGIPLLRGHFFESAENPQKEHRIGSLGTDAEFVAPYLRNSLIVTDQEAIDAIESGKEMEISAAYRYKPDFTPGEYNGTAYDFAMRDIVANHAAIVSEGRAGPDVVVEDSQINPNPTKRGIIMGLKDIADKAIEFFTAVKEKGEELDDESKAVGKEILGDMEPIFAGDPENEPAEDEDEDMMKHPWYAAASEEAREVFDKINAKKDEELMAEIEARLGKGEPVDDELPIEIVEQMKAAGLDPENEEVARAFMEGMKAIEKAEGEDCDMPGMKNKAEDEEVIKEKEKEEIFTAQDAAIRIARASAQAETRAIAKMRSLHKAAGEVESLCGKLDPLAFDSAAGIYTHALKSVGRKPSTKDETALREMVAMAADAKHAALTPAYPKFEQQEYDGPFKHLNNIRTGV